MGSVYSYSNLICHVWLICMGGWPSAEQKWSGIGGAGVLRHNGEGLEREEGGETVARWKINELKIDK